MSAQLEGVFQVAESQAVQCQAPGCGRRVWAAMHVVRDEGGYRIFGGDCFAELFGAERLAWRSRYGSALAPKLLTREEREQLAENAQRFIEQLDSQAQPLVQPVHEAAPAFTAAERRQAEAEAQHALEARFPGVDFDLAGWRGWVRVEGERLLREALARP